MVRFDLPNSVISNVRNIGIVSASDNIIRLFFPIQTIYYLSIGISFSGIALGLVIFNITAFLFEYPSGYLADKLGRKFTLIVSAFTFFMSLVILFTINSTFMLCIANLLMGIAYAMNSGADQALLYDTLKKAGQESSYQYYYAKIQYYAALLAACFALSSGFLASIDFKLPFFLAVILYIPVIYCALSIKEDRNDANQRKALSPQEMYAIFTHTILKRKDLLWFMLLSSLVSSIAWSSQHFIYPKFVYSELDLPLHFLGITFFLFHLVRAFASKFVPVIRALWEGVGIYYAMLGTLTFCYLGIIFFPSILTIICLVLIDTNEIVKRILISSDLNSRIESENRASILSVEGFAKWGVWGIHALITGLIIDNFGFHSACVFQVILYLLLGFYLYQNRSWVGNTKV